MTDADLAARRRGYRPLTQREAEAAWEAAEPVMLSDERVEEIVAEVLRRAKTDDADGLARGHDRV